RRLGGGGMATVWMAEDIRLGRQVAVKVISDALAAQALYVERFRREARIAAGLSHLNLVKVYDFGSDGERSFLVMEYSDGAALGPLLAGSSVVRGRRRQRVFGFRTADRSFDVGRFVAPVVERCTSAFRAGWCNWHHCSDAGPRRHGCDATARHARRPSPRMA